MTSLAAQIIDQQVSGLVERHGDALGVELRPGRDEHRKRALAFLFLVARAAFDLADEDALDGIVDGGDDFGIDALYFESPDDGELPVTVVQGKYKRDLGGDSAFPETGVAGQIDAIGALFEDALAPLFTGRERTLQRLSATFRRADLVDTLLEAPERGG